MLKKAIVIGATGLVGKELVKKLLTDTTFEYVSVFHRRSTGLEHPKLREHIIDFDDIESWENLIHGDVLFSALGTTLKQAGSQKAQYMIDYHYQYNTAKKASMKGVGHFVLVSSTGADSGSKLFYPRMKGELEEAVKHLPFKHIDILRPSVLLGKRDEFRWGEKVGAVVANALKWIPGLKKYRGINGYEVAQAMINSTKHVQPEQKVRIHELEGVFDLLK